MAETGNAQSESSKESAPPAPTSAEIVAQPADNIAPAPVAAVIQVPANPAAAPTPEKLESPEGKPGASNPAEVKQSQNKEKAVPATPPVTPNTSGEQPPQFPPPISDPPTLPPAKIPAVDTIAPAAPALSEVTAAPALSEVTATPVNPIANLTFAEIVASKASPAPAVTSPIPTEGKPVIVPVLEQSTAPNTVPSSTSADVAISANSTVPVAVETPPASVVAADVTGVATSVVTAALNVTATPANLTSAPTLVEAATSAVPATTTTAAPPETPKSPGTTKGPGSPAIPTGSDVPVTSAVTAPVFEIPAPPAKVDSNSNDEWDERQSELLSAVLELENAKREAASDALRLQLKVRDEEVELLRARVQTLETELVAALSKPGTKNHVLVETIKQQHEELLSKARGMLFDKTKIVKNQELQIEALTSQVASLKDVNSITKDLLEIRNSEIKHLEERLESMESRFKCEKERHMLVLKRAETGQSINNDLKVEYETQLKIFKELREKYEQRVQALMAENKRLTEAVAAAQTAPPEVSPST